jgi:hypothetical protein
VELIPVGRARGKADAAGERVERADGVRQGCIQVGNDGVRVGARGELVQEDALHGR